MTLGQDWAQAAALELDDSLASKVRMSHIVFESVNMGLFLKYILEGGYEVDIDFSKEIMMNHNGKDIDFSFSEFQARREDAAKEKNNGRIRCPMESKGKLLQKGGLFSSD